jgi:hypothetical protein
LISIFQSGCPSVGGRWVDTFSSRNPCWCAAKVVLGLEVVAENLGSCLRLTFIRLQIRQLSNIYIDLRHCSSSTTSIGSATTSLSSVGRDVRSRLIDVFHQVNEPLNHQSPAG